VTGSREIKELVSVNEPKTSQINADAARFEEWCDRQTFTPDMAVAADSIIRFLKMPEVPPALLGALAEAVQRLDDQGVSISVAWELPDRARGSD
jgi:hypothetical protein